METEPDSTTSRLLALRDAGGELPVWAFKARSGALWLSDGKTVRLTPAGRERAEKLARRRSRLERRVERLERAASELESTRAKLEALTLCPGLKVDELGYVCRIVWGGAADRELSPEELVMLVREGLEKAPGIGRWRVCPTDGRLIDLSALSSGGRGFHLG